jgi:RNA polymerase sigma-70 factor (ECF subfamily)
MHLNTINTSNDKAGASTGFDEWIPESRKHVYAIAFRMLGNRSDAEDAAQETLVRVWSSLSSYDSRRSYYGWISRIATNLCIDRLRRRRRSEMSLEYCLNGDSYSDGTSFDLADSSQDPEKMLFDNSIGESLEVGMVGLPAANRDCLLLFAQGQSYAEIAARQNCELGTVRSRLHRARAHVRRAISM